MAETDFRTVHLKIEYKVLECSYDPIFLYPCNSKNLKSEEVSFVLDQCLQMDHGRFCDSRWDAGVHTIEGFEFRGAVIVQDYLESTSNRETTIHGWMKSGDQPDSSAMNFSLYIDSGKLAEPVRVAGVTLAKPADEQKRIYTYTPQLKISPIQR